MPIELTKKTYRPSMTVGQLYARAYGATTLPMPVGNVLALGLEHTENVQTQEDFTRLGGGTHAEVRRVTAVAVNATLADLNVVNLARAALGTVESFDGGTATDEAHDATRGGLVRLAHIAPTLVTVKKGADSATATEVAMAGNYEVRAEGIFLLPEAADIADTDKLWVSYTYGAYAAIEALTTKAVELELTFGGMNEADSGKPVIVDIFRASQGVTQALTLIGNGFNSLQVTGNVLMDPNKSGEGVSRYYRTRLA